MFQHFDIYTVKARLAPALVIALPIGMALGSWLPSDQESWGLLSTGINSFALMALLSQLAHSPGKRLEKKLFKEWGGMPSALILSYAHTELSHISLHRYHTRLRELIPGIELPNSADEERNDLDKFMLQYESASDWLRATTRDREKFRLVFAELVNYGYRRNLLGLKPHGIIAWSLGFIICGLRVLSPILPWSLATGWNWLAITYTPCCMIMILVWLIVVLKKWVKPVAFQYGKQLVEAVDLL